MATFYVHITQQVGVTIPVEADSLDDALESFWDSPKIPGSMSNNAFDSAPVEESGDWEPCVAYDADFIELWSKE